MAHHSNEPVNIHDEVNYDPTVWVPKAHSHGTKALMQTFLLLSVITIVDIILYFSIDPGMTRNVIFIGLGIVKAAFIVYVFMHLTYEQKALKMSIVLPMILVLYLIAYLLWDSDFWHFLNY
ncbi:MAG: cytochrome C oxidase subunit IV family protein [Flavobacteriales bacterium]|nr:cytochrome C oxidase subunit IV family protein [Flavobacteriales bacterium]